MCFFNSKKKCENCEKLHKAMRENTGMKHLRFLLTILTLANIQNNAFVGI